MMRAAGLEQPYRGIDIDADQRAQPREAAVDIDVVVCGTEFRTEGDDEIGLGEHAAHGFHAGAGGHTERMAGEHAARIDRGDDGGADALGPFAGFALVAVHILRITRLCSR